MRMAGLDQTSTLQFKKCLECGKIKNRNGFYPNKHKKDGLRTYCKKCQWQLEKMYRKGRRARVEEKRILKEQGLNRCIKCQKVKPITEFYKTKKHTNGYDNICKQCEKKRKEPYRQSDRCKALHEISRRRYNQTPKGIMTVLRYNLSDKRRAYANKYYKEYLLKHPNYVKEKYHNLQEKYSCYHKIDTWYPIDRQMDALLTAPIVEIKA